MGQQQWPQQWGAPMHPQHAAMGGGFGGGAYRLPPPMHAPPTLAPRLPPQPLGAAAARMQPGQVSHTA
jgi:hypothetical protein